MLLNKSPLNGTALNGDLPPVDGVVYEETLSDAAALADGATLSSERNRAQVSGFDMIDNAVGITIRGRVSSDAFPVYDLGRELLIEALMDNAVTLIDGLVSEYLPGSGDITEVTKTDSVLFVDDVTRYAERGRTASESLSISDTLLGYAERNRHAADAINLDSQLSRWLERNRTASDELNLVDALLWFRTLTRLASDAFEVIDGTTSFITGGTVHERTASDTLRVYDLGRRLLLEVHASDATTLVDSYSKMITGAGSTTTTTVTDTVNPQDATQQYRLRTSLAESVGIALSDSEQHARELNRRHDDASDMSDEVRWHRQLLRLTEDLAGIIDDVDKTITGSGSITNTTITDVLNPQDSTDKYRLRTSVAESAGIALTDQTQQFRHLFRMTEDLVSTIDQIIAQLFESGDINTAVVTDSVTFSDGQLMFRNLTSRATETISVGDESLLSQLFGRTTASTIQVNDALIASQLHVRATADGIVVSDGVIAFSFRLRHADDALAAYDELQASYLPFIQYLYQTRPRLGMYDPILFSSAAGIELQEFEPCVFSAHTNNPLGSRQQAIFGGYN